VHLAQAEYCLGHEYSDCRAPYVRPSTCIRFSNSTFFADTCLKSKLFGFSKSFVTDSYRATIGLSDGVSVDHALNSQYSPSMHGTLLDQRVFESLVHKCLPIIHDHFQDVDVQLSVASLPWFLSLYINSMPLIFAFRIVDCFFCMGPKVLFQVGYVNFFLCTLAHK